MESKQGIIGMDASDGEAIIDESEEEDAQNENNSSKEENMIENDENSNPNTESQAQNERINKLIEQLKDLPNGLKSQEIKESILPENVSKKTPEIETFISSSTDSFPTSLPQMIESSDAGIEIPTTDSEEEIKEKTNEKRENKEKIQNSSYDTISDELGEVSTESDGKAIEVSSDSSEDSIEETPPKRVVKPLKSLKQPAIPLRTIQQQKKKQQQITEFIDDSQNESDKTTEVFRMIVKICELFKNRFTFPQVLATIHCCAGDVERAISILKDSGPLGDAETLLDPSKIDAPKQLKDEYFQV